MSTLKKMQSYYGRCAYWMGGLDRITACWRAKEQAGVEYTEAEWEKIVTAGRKLNEAKQLFNEVWSKRLGDQLTYEIRSKH